ncbi:hypothetical protein THOD04_70281 [Vibrio owensii]|nr:hypothetical protein THOD04_70281 [Vibrio owensii]
MVAGVKDEFVNCELSSEGTRAWETTSGLSVESERQSGAFKVSYKVIQRLN